MQVGAPGGVRLRRQRLIERIIADEAVRVVVVEAPGGHGKSSLVQDALQETGASPAWYSAHDDERDPQAFLAYLIEAIIAACPRMGTQAREASASGQVPPMKIVGLLLNEIMDVGAPVHLVIDDAHRVASEAVLQLLDAIIQGAPENLRLYVLTREPLAIHLARQLLQRRALKIDVHDLAFTGDEVRALFEDVWSCPLDDDVLHKLLAKSGGWITVLVLVHMALERRSAAAARDIVDAMQDSNDLTFAYLTEEILNTQPAHIQGFLKETSILQQFDADAAAWVTRMPTAAQLIADVDARKLFLVPVDVQRGLYRYHHLFESFLRQTLSREVGSAGWRERHAHASEYYMERDIRLAIGHAIEACQWTRVAELLAEHGSGFMRRGWSEHVATWLDALPRAQQQEHPRLLLLRGAVEDMHGDWVTACKSFEAAMERFHAVGDRAGLSEAMERNALCLGKYGDWQRTKEFLAQAHALCPPDDLSLRARIHAWDGANLSLLGESWEQAYDSLRESYRLAHRSGDPEAIAAACFSYGFQGHLAQGDFEGGIRVLQEGIELFRELNNAYAILHMEMNCAVLEFFLGRLDEAERRLEEAAQLVPGLDGTFAALAQESTLAKIKLERLDLDGCEAHLRVLGQQEIPWQLRPWYCRTLYLLHARRGNWALAESAQRAMFDALRMQGIRGMYAPECFLADAAALAMRGDLQAARAQATTAAEIAREGRLRFWEMKAAAWLAWLAVLAEGTLGPEADALEDALRHTRESGYDGFWLNDFGGFTIPLLVRAAASGRYEAWARSLLTRLGARAHASLTDILEGDAPQEHKADG